MGEVDIWLRLASIVMWMNGWMGHAPHAAACPHGAWGIVTIILVGVIPLYLYIMAGPRVVGSLSLYETIVAIVY